jgi:MraZ protein
MGYLFGTFDNIRVDEHGRFSMPATLRKALIKKADSTFVIIRGPVNGSLLAYPKDQWLKVWDDLKFMTISSESNQSIDRMLGTLKETRLDAQGRVTLPQKLKDISGIQQNLTLVGRGELIEIWDNQAWDAYQRRAEEKPYDQDYFRIFSEISRKKNER